LPYTRSSLEQSSIETKEAKYTYFYIIIKTNGGRKHAAAINFKWLIVVFRVDSEQGEMFS